MSKRKTKRTANNTDKPSEKAPWIKDSYLEGLSMHDEVTVCSVCLMACCHQGIFYCDDYRSAGTVQKTVEELVGLMREHPFYWRRK